MERSLLIKRLIEANNCNFGGEYDYSLVGDIVSKKKDKLPIICKKHGVFYKTFEKHVTYKQGCPKCSGRFRYDTDSFISEIKDKFGYEHYSFEKVKYVNNKTKVIVTCTETDENGVIHGDFEITPGHMLAGEGCPKCRYIKSAQGKRRSIKELVEEARKVHGDKYDYSLITEYKNDRIKYPIICPIHGIFYQTFNNHIQGEQGCPRCGRKKCDESRILSFEEFVERANLVHDGKYEYDKCSYTKLSDNIRIICPKHGEFYQSASNHIHLGHGCPKCANTESKGELELLEYINKIVDGEGVIRRDRKTINGIELDIYIPSKKIAFEYNGLYWHSELSKDKNYHLEKTNKCTENGIRLIHIFEDEWEFKKDIVKSVVKNALGKSDNVIYARNCEIKEVSPKDSKQFLELNHLQGGCNSSTRYGLYSNGELVSLMTFGKSRHFIGNNGCDYELLRFCNKINTNVVGGASKLFKHFINEHEDINRIVSYADKRWASGNLYNILGFEKYNESKPNYYYIINKKRVYRFNLRKSILEKNYGCPKEMTEKEFCLTKHWYRIYDCGCLCFEWKRKL